MTRKAALLRLLSANPVWAGWWLGSIRCALPVSRCSVTMRRLSAADVYATTGLGHRRVARNPHVIRYAIDFIDPS
jgi:hypothetical protein